MAHDFNQAPNATSSFALRAYAEELPTLERSLEAISNEAQELRAQGDTDGLEMLQTLANEALAQFAMEELERDPVNGPCKVAMMRAIVADGFGRRKDVLRYDLESLELAQDDKDKSKALNNVGAAYLSLGDAATALQYAQRCLDLAGHTGWAVANWFAAKASLDGVDVALAEALPLVHALDADAGETFRVHFDIDGSLRPLNSDPRVRSLLAELRTQRKEANDRQEEIL